MLQGTRHLDPVPIKLFVSYLLGVDDSVKGCDETEDMLDVDSMPFIALEGENSIFYEMVIIEHY